MIPSLKARRDLSPGDARCESVGLNEDAKQFIARKADDDEYLQTLTSQSNTKRNFRKSEILMREVELFSTLASIFTRFAYPKEVNSHRVFPLSKSLCASPKLTYLFV